MKRSMKAVAGLHVAFAAMLTAQAAMASGAVVASRDKSVLYWSVHQPSERAAINNAMSQCGARFGGDCVLEKSFNEGCVAVARSNSHRHWGYAWRKWEGAARDAAMTACDETGSHSCEIQTAFCE